MKIDGLTVGQWFRSMHPMRAPEGGEGGGGAGGGAAPSGEGGSGTEGGDDGESGDAGEGGEENGDAGSDKDDYVDDPDKTAEENAEAKAAHDEAVKAKAKAKEGEGENELVGAPEGDYEDFEVPEGLELNEEVKTEFDKLSRDLNLSDAGRKRLVEIQGKLYHQAAERHAEQVTSWAEEVRKDKVLGGKNFEQNAGLARNAIKEFGTPELKEMLEKTGYGNHPEFVRFAYNVGKSMSEGKATNDGNRSDAAEDAATILYGGT